MNMPLIGSTNEEKIWNFLKAQGFTDAGTAGLMGNLYAESGLRPNNLQNTYEGKLGMTDAEYTELVDKGIYTNFVHDKAGYGLAQWTYWSRKEALLAYAKAAGKSIGNLEMQLGYLLKELSSYGLLGSLKSATSVREASNLILLKFEKPASMNTEVTQSRRTGFGQKYFDMYAKKGTASAGKGDSGAMKYTSANPPIQCFMRQSTWYKGAGEVIPRGVLIHSTGANNTRISRYVQPDDNAPDRAKMLELLGTNKNRNDWNHISRQAGVNAWLGKLADGKVSSVQTGPWNKKAWGCGFGKAGSCNNGWIQFEICEDSLTDKSYFDAIYQEAVELTAYLCKLYGLNPTGTVKYNGINVPVILCHQDSYRLGLGSNHGDVLHWFPKFGKSMDSFRQDVKAKMGGVASDKPTTSTGSSQTVVNYKVRITATDLNIRKGPGTNNDRVGVIAPGVYTIVGEANGQGATLWGKLKSGKGWVSLDFCKKL